MKRFTVYRTDLKGSKHTELQKNAENQPQFEGCVFSDGRVAVRWLTPVAAFSIWDNFGHLMHVHGHPEYGTIIVFHDKEHEVKEIKDESRQSLPLKKEPTDPIVQTGS